MHPTVRNVVLGGSQPFDFLGSALVEEWDAGYGVTQSGGQVSAWRGRLLGLTLSQAVGGSKPLYSDTGMAGRPTLLFDGIDDFMTQSGVSGLPVGSVPSEIWALVDQAALIADLTTRVIINYGTVAAATARNVRRVNNLSQQAARAAVGTIISDNTGALFAGRSLVRGRFTPSGTVECVLNGIAGPVAAGAFTTTDAAVTIGSTNGLGGFWSGSIAYLSVTGALTAEQAFAYTNYLKNIGGIS